MKAHRVCWRMTIVSSTSAPIGGAWLTPRARRLIPGKGTRYPLYRSQGGLQGQRGRMRKISPPTGFDLRIFRSVASRYTDYSIPAHLKSIQSENKYIFINKFT